MIRRRTVLILGAGASIPFGFPSGRSLKDEICQGLSGGPLFQQLKACGLPGSDIQAFGEALRGSGRASVDAFLEHRSDFLVLGKQAIAAALIPYEIEARLFGGDHNWYEYLYGRLISSPADIPTAQERLSVITFNYDRSFEHFLCTALRNSFNLSLGEALQRMKGFSIVHVYGQLGALAWALDGMGARPYEGLPEDPSRWAQVVPQAAQWVKIVHEGAQNQPEFQQARGLIERAEAVCFLGFGYLPANVERLGVTGWPRDTPVYGSGYRLAEGPGTGEAQIVRDMFGRKIVLGPEEQDVLEYLRRQPILV
jgi:hypothetical protein